MIDDNDITARPQYWLSSIHDPLVEAQLLALRRGSSPILDDDHVAVRDASRRCRFRCSSSPGPQFHYTNIGYKTLGIIAEKAGHASLDTLYHRFIIDAARACTTSVRPDRAVARHHATPYIVEKYGNRPGRDPSRHGRPVRRPAGSSPTCATRPASSPRSCRERSCRDAVSSLQSSSEVGSYGFGTGVTSMCGDTVFQHGGATRATTAEVAVNADGSRVVVLLLNGRTWNSWGDSKPEQALQTLYCAS